MLDFLNDEILKGFKATAGPEWSDAVYRDMPWSTITVVETMEEAAGRENIAWLAQSFRSIKGVPCMRGQLIFKSQGIENMKAWLNSQ